MAAGVTAQQRSTGGRCDWGAAYHPIHHRRAIACAELGLLYLLFFSALRVARSTAAPPSVTCAMCSDFPNSTPPTRVQGTTCTVVPCPCASLAARIQGLMPLSFTSIAFMPMMTAVAALPVDPLAKFYQVQRHRDAAPTYKQCYWDRSHERAPSAPITGP